MPPVIAVFIALQLLGHGHTVLKGDSAVWKRVDPQANAQRMPKTSVEYILTTAPWHGRRADKKGGCDFSILAFANGRTPMRLNIGGKEQLLDTSWAFKTRIAGGTRMTMAAWFIDPVTWETASYQTVTFRCRRRDNRPGPAFEMPDMSGVR